MLDMAILGCVGLFLFGLVLQITFFNREQAANYGQGIVIGGIFLIIAVILTIIRVSTYGWF